MSNGSFYFRDNPAFKGGSEQAVYEELWERGRRRRLIVCGVVASAALVIGAKVASPFVGLLMGVAAGLGAMAGQWWRRAMHGVWLRGRRGDRRTARVLRLLVEPRGYTVLHGRSVPGHGTIDQLVIGPQGVWLINSQSWAPDTEVARYGEKLFIGRGEATPDLRRLAATATTAGALLTARLRAHGTAGTPALPAAPPEPAHAAARDAPEADRPDGADEPAGERRAPVIVPAVTVTPILTVYGGRLPLRGVCAAGVILARSYHLPLRIGRRRHAGLSPDQVTAVVQAAIHALPIGDHTMADR